MPAYDPNLQKNFIKLLKQGLEEEKVDTGAKNPHPVAAKIVWPTGREEPPANNELGSIDGKRVFVYKIKIPESFGKQETGFDIIGAMGDPHYDSMSSEILSYIDDDDQDGSKKAVDKIMRSVSSKSAVFYHDSATEVPAFGDEVAAVPIQSGMQDEYRILTIQTRNKDISKGGGKSPDPDFSRLSGQEKFFNKNGFPCSVATENSKGSVTVSNNNVNMACLDEEMYNAVFKLAENTGYDLVVTNAFRTDADTRRIYKNIGKPPPAKTKKGRPHEYGFAVDLSSKGFSQYENGKWVENDQGKKLRAEAQKLGLVVFDINHIPGHPHFHIQTATDNQSQNELCSEEALEKFYKLSSGGED